MLNFIEKPNKKKAKKKINKELLMETCNETDIGIAGCSNDAKCFKTKLKEEYFYQCKWLPCF